MTPFLPNDGSELVLQLSQDYSPAGHWFCTYYRADDRVRIAPYFIGADHEIYPTSRGVEMSRAEFEEMSRSMRDVFERRKRPRSFEMRDARCPCGQHYRQANVLSFGWQPRVCPRCCDGPSDREGER